MLPNSNWTKLDRIALTSAQDECRTNKDYKLKCLIKFKKTQELTYEATCGDENNK